MVAPRMIQRPLHHFVVPLPRSVPFWGGAIAASFLTATAAQAVPERLTDASVRAFVARQEAAWNARDAAGFRALFTPDARFVDQARGSDNSVVPNGESSLDQATTQAKRFFARAPFHETAQVLRVEIVADGRQARVFGYEVTRIAPPGRAPRTLCAETEQVLVLAGGRIRSRGQTDTAVRCPRVPR